ncbi:MAG: putative deacylase [Kiritimatiellia bacterium]|jgi:predicted deacylase
MRTYSRQVAVGGEPDAPPLTVLIVDSESPGPTVLVTANVHGDELTGLLAVQRLNQRLPGELTSGRVVLYPSLNPSGLQALQRQVPADGGDLNRSFPGRRRGPATERLAHGIWKALLDEGPDVLIDLHADALLSVPYAIIDRVISLRGAARRRLEGQLNELADSAGLTTIHEYPEDKYRRFKLDQSLAGAMVNRVCIPAITIEAGPRKVAHHASAEAAVWAVRRVLSHRDMIGLTLAPHASQVVGGPWQRAGVPRAQREGLLQTVVGPGETFEAGATLARVVALNGSLVDELRAPRAGLLVSWADAGWLTVGAVAGTLALKED